MLVNLEMLMKDNDFCEENKKMASEKVKMENYQPIL